MVHTKQTFQLPIMLVKELEFPEGTGEVRIELNPKFDPTRVLVFTGPLKRLQFPDCYPSTPVEKTRRIDYVPNASRSVIAKGRRRLVARSSSSSSVVSSEASVGKDEFVEQLQRVRDDLAKTHRRQKALLQEAFVRQQAVKKLQDLEARRPRCRREYNARSSAMWKPFARKRRALSVSKRTSRRLSSA